MTSERECFVYVVLPGQTEFVTAGRFRVSETRDGTPLGQFVYGRRYLSRNDAAELDPVELQLAGRIYETARMSGFFGTIRDSTCRARPAFPASSFSTVCCSTSRSRDEVDHMIGINLEIAAQV